MKTLSLRPALVFARLSSVLSATTSFVTIKSNSDCLASSVDLGAQANLQACSDACAAVPACSFFIQGPGKCEQKLANVSSCPSGFVEVDGVSFYQLRRAGVAGCTDPRASNYDAGATESDSSCIGQSACVQNADGTCKNCVTDPSPHMCTNGNDGYVNDQFDTIYASRVPNGAITIDGSLRDWAAHDMTRCYTDVAFATTTGDVVVFEAHEGGVWYGPSDFSVRFMLSWDETNLYLAAEVTDDVLQVGNTCYSNGLQAAFEVGGASSPAGQGMLQAQRSKDASISRLQLINVGLQPSQICPQTGGASCSSELADPNGCCMDYELSQSGGFSRRTRSAVLRNPISKVTTFEVAYALDDLFAGTGGVQPNGALDHFALGHWREGLRFGFSFLVNDGDESTSQQGWAGYYPHSLVEGWNGGQKQPWKVGVLQLRGADTTETCGSCTGWIFFGTFILAPMLAAAAFGGRYVYRKRAGGPPARTANPLAGADQMSSTPALTVVPTPTISSTV